MKLSSLAALSVGVLLSGCSSQAPEPPALPAVAPPPAVAVAPAPEVSEPEVAYSYVPMRRDPFARGEHCCRPAPLPSCTGPLCRYSLDELKLAGVISGLANPVAVIESPRGKGYPVYRGTQVGKRGGVVKQVLRDAIIVAEVWHDGQVSREEEITLRVKPDAPIELDE